MLRRLTFRTLIVALAGWPGPSTAVDFAVTVSGGDPNPRAVILMGTGLVVLWVGLCGTVMYLARDRVRTFVLSVHMDWRVLFVVMATLLRPVDFHPHAVFLLFGLMGRLAEAKFGGAKAIAEMAMWIFVYGLMVYLPAYCVPAGRGSRSPCWWHFPLAVVLPLVFAIPVAAVIGQLHPVRIHFPSIAPGS